MTRVAGGRGFSVTELVVVIGLVMLLLGLLLPSLAASRDAARLLACQANLRQAATLSESYSLDHDGWIVGGPTTSGWDAMMGPRGVMRERTVFGVATTSRAAIPLPNPMFNGVSIQAWDWMGPLLHTSNWVGPGERVALAGGETHDAARAHRLDWYRSGVDFLSCPTNGATATPYEDLSGAFGAGPMLPYAQSTQFTSTIATAPLGTGPTRPNLRVGYSPRVERVGPASMKGLFFEGHRYTFQSEGPDFDVGIDAEYGGMFADTGPWYKESKALDRSMAPGEWRRSAGFGRQRDNRPLAFRHGPRGRGELAGVTRGNVAFFDTHVKVMTDLEATSPAIWFPSGTKLAGPGEFWETTREAFPLLLSGEGVAP